MMAAPAVVPLARMLDTKCTRRQRYGNKCSSYMCPRRGCVCRQSTALHYCLHRFNLVPSQGVFVAQNSHPRHSLVALPFTTPLQGTTFAPAQTPTSGRSTSKGVGGARRLRAATSAHKHSSGPQGSSHRTCTQVDATVTDDPGLRLPPSLPRACT